MNFPNFLTLFRILLAVLFMRLLYLKGPTAKLAAIFIFLLASFTDYWDGYFARKWNQSTAFGKFMDPVADKVLVLAAFIAFFQMRVLPLWIVIVILARDFLITGLRLAMPKGREWKGTTASGKHKTVLQFVSITAILLFLFFKETDLWKQEWTPVTVDFIYKWMIFVVIVTLWSGAQYIIKNRSSFRSKI